ncbi:hypothetical protein SteCoe_32569 [Stentor coeruleus]|uniref:Uncharacterized protein n=1 Tax=Stentor coeruleus TaxID=5963 RepID=A0A1R2AYN8_9CILI|nr:hypothetical protein SteCoe_32569 [Stentor coeruleus]
MNSTLSVRIKNDESLNEARKLVTMMASKNFFHPLVSYACSELGIPNDHVIPIKYTEIEDKNVSKELNDLRYHHIEARRKAKINLITTFLINQNLILSSQKPSTAKTPSTPNPSRPNDKQNQSSPNSSYAQEVFTERKKLHYKNQIIHKLTVEENLKIIKKQEEEARKATEQKIKQKEKREKILNRNTKNFEIRDKRIKERLEKKNRDIEEHELEAMKMDYKSQAELKNHYQSYTPPHRHVEVIYIQSEGIDDTEAKLELITSRLNQSAQRAKKILLEKAWSGQIMSKNIYKVKTNREELEHKKEEDNMQKILKMQHDLQYSNRRRIELINEQKKISKSAVHAKRKLQEEEKIWMEKNRESEIKDGKIMKIRKEIRESNELKSSFLNMKIALRKKDQEDNLKRIQIQQNKDKIKLIEKIKESENGNKGKEVIDFPQVKADAVKEFKKRLRRKGERPTL